MNIFKIQQSKEEKKFLKENLDIEFDVAVDIVETACELPYLGSLFKLGRVALNIRDWHFVQKLATYLKQIEDVDESKKEEFIRNLSPEDNQRISKFMINLLYNAEEDRKAEILGKIYRARLLGMIDNEMMLRLCSIVDRIFVDDLDHLYDYVKEVDMRSIYSDILNAYGLLSVSDATSYNQNNGFINLGGVTIKLNEIGIVLLRIIE